MKAKLALATGAALCSALAMASAAPAAVAAAPTTGRPANAHSHVTPTSKPSAAKTRTITTPASASAAAASCPSPGHRIKTSSDPTVYLVGPSGVLYFFSNSTEYFGLYSSYSGITTVSNDVLGACGAQSDGTAYELPGLLRKTSSSPKVYIYDPVYAGGWRWITSQSVFDAFGFDSSKIETGTVSPIAANWS
jgi:hypothetical protein